MSLKKFFVLLFSFLLFQVSVYSQTAQISGNIKDMQSNLPISSAYIEILDLNTGSRYTTQSVSNGNWSINLTGINEKNVLPFQFSLDQNYPNPFNPSTKIGFSINKEGNVILRVYNILGQELDHKAYYLSPGAYSIDWFSKGSTAVLFYSIEMDGMKLSRKMLQIEGGNGGFGSLASLASLSNRSISKIVLDKQNKNFSLNYKLLVTKIGYMPDSTIITAIDGSLINFNLETVHHNAFFIDLHNDLLEATAGVNYDWGVRHTTLQTDIPRLIDGGIDAQIFAVWVDPTNDSNYYNKSIGFINTFNNQINSNSTKIGQARNEKEINDLNANSKIAAILGVEGGHSIENDISKLKTFYNLGARYLTIAWNNSTDWAISAADERSKTQGLSDFGKNVIRTLDSLGMIVDVSHTGVKTVEDILSISKNPIIASHSGAYSIKQHTRNLTDDQIKAIAAKGGVIGIVFYPPFLVSRGSANIDSVIKHLDYIVKLVGIDYVAIGSDFDGMSGAAPLGLENTSKYPSLTLALLNKGYSIPDVKKILGENFLRVFRKVCK